MKFHKDGLHPGIQSDVDGERLGLEPFIKNLRVPQGRALHIEQVWRRSVEKPRSYVRAKKSADRRTDRQTDGFSPLYSRLRLF